MNLYKVVCKPTKAAHNNDVVFRVAAPSIYCAQDIAKEYISKRDLRFVSIALSNQVVVVDTGVRSDLTVRNCENVPRYVECR